MKFTAGLSTGLRFRRAKISICTRNNGHNSIPEVRCERATQRLPFREPFCAKWLSLARSDRPDKKYYIITESNIKIYFGASGYSDSTIHKDEQRKQRYINRHKTNENWLKSGIDTAGFGSRWLLWNKPSIKDSYMDIKRRFKI